MVFVSYYTIIYHLYRLIQFLLSYLCNPLSTTPCAIPCDRWTICYSVPAHLLITLCAGWLDGQRRRWRWQWMCAPTYQQVIILQSLHDLRGPSPPSLVRHSLTQSVSRSGRTINQVHVLRLPLLLSSTAQQILITRGERSMQSNEFADSHSTGSFQSKHTPAQQTERQTERHNVSNRASRCGR